MARCIFVLSITSLRGNFHFEKNEKRSVDTQINVRASMICMKIVIKRGKNEKTVLVTKIPNTVTSNVSVTTQGKDESCECSIHNYALVDMITKLVSIFDNIEWYVDVHNFIRWGNSHKINKDLSERELLVEHKNYVSENKEFIKESVKIFLAIEAKV